MVHGISTVLLAALTVSSTILGTFAADFRVRGINYSSRAGADWAAPKDKCKTTEDITADLKTLRGLTSNLRLFSLMDCDQDANVIPQALDMGFQLDLGLWVGEDGAGFKEEKKRLKALIDEGIITSDTIAHIHVGSEAVYREDVTVAAIIGYFNEIKDLVPDIPITIADIGDVYLANTELIEAVDVVSANFFPFWEKKDVDEAVSRFYQQYSDLLNKADEMGKSVFISETGWASDGKSENASDATPENAATYLHDFVRLAEEHDIDYYYFEGFDEPHKTSEDGTVETAFGIYTIGRELKPEIAALNWKSITFATDDGCTQGCTKSPSDIQSDGQEDGNSATKPSIFTFAFSCSVQILITCWMLHL